MTATTIFSAPPGQLEAARELSHAAVQWPSRAARANLPPADDDSHSNLGWDEAGFSLLSRSLDTEGQHRLGFSFRSFSLLWFEGSEPADTFALVQATEAEARRWCDAHLSAAGLKSTDHAEMPYELEPVDYRDFTGAASPVELEVLGAWFSKAQAALDGLVARFGDRAISRPSVRCWPHHYDLGTLFVLEDGDPETARSVGAGLSPGDGSYAEPYFYCTPWPTPAVLPEAPAPMHWHTEDFRSLVCEASALDEAIDLPRLLTAAFETALGSLR